MTKNAMLIAALGLSACGGEAMPSEATINQPAAASASRDRRDDDDLPLKEAKLIIEHNATALDTGFQVFVDGEPWKELNIVGPNGRSLLRVKPQGSLARLGLTELFFETNEPPNAEVPIEEILAHLPEGEYDFEARSVDGIDQEGTALLTHAIPAGPVITAPPEGGVVSRQGLVIRWNPVGETIAGEPITLAAYEIIVVKDVPPHPHAFARPRVDIHVPPSVTSITVPSEFLEPRTAYLFEVMAIEETGNQTFSEGSFETE